MLDTPVTPEIPARENRPVDPLDQVSSWPPPAPHRPSRRRRGLGAAVALVVSTAAAAGGAAGWFAARASQDAAASSSTPTPTAVATSMGSSVLADGGMDVAAVLASAEASIVEINTTMSYRQGPFRMEGEGAGTGMVLTADGLVLTNAHVGGRRHLDHREAERRHVVRRHGRAVRQRRRRGGDPARRRDRADAGDVRFGRRRGGR